MNGVIDICELNFSYQVSDNDVISNLSCRIPCKNIIGIVGESGIGKSTLLKLISGVYRQSDNLKFKYDGEIRISGIPPDNLIGTSKVTMLPQKPFLLNHLNVKKNILLPYMLSKSIINSNNNIYSYLINILGLKEYENFMPLALSSGLKTRVAFARSIIVQSDYLFMDEPFTSLDIIRRWNMYKSIVKLRSNLNNITILTTHDIWEAIILSDVILMMKKESGKHNIYIYENERPDIDKISVNQCYEFIQDTVSDFICKLAN
jgi:ABC-type nitrate/sulfonate/bicarbonate transport system ATPase subunit